MLWAFFGSLLASIGKIFYKRSIDIASNISNFMFKFVGYTLGGGSIAIVLLLLGFFHYAEILSWNIFLLTVLFVVIEVASIPVGQNLYRVEKVTNLLPYENLNKIFTIIIGFLFLAKEVSVTSFVITLITIVAIIAFSIDYEKVSFPKNFKNILLFQSLCTLKYVIIGYMLLTVSTETFFVFKELLTTFVLLLLVLGLGQAHEFKKITKPFFFNRWFSALCGGGNALIGMFLIESYGIVITILLSFVSVAMTVIFSYFILKERPTIKTLVMTVVVTALVGLGFYFRG